MAGQGWKESLLTPNLMEIWLLFFIFKFYPQMFFWFWPTNRSIVFPFQLIFKKKFSFENKNKKQLDLVFYFFLLPIETFDCEQTYGRKFGILFSIISTLIGLVWGVCCWNNGHSVSMANQFKFIFAADWRPRSQ